MSYIKKADIEDEKEKNLAKWEKEEKDQLVWIFPNALKNWEKRLNLKRTKQILVRNTEKALVYHQEMIVQELSSGLYTVDRKKGLIEHKIAFFTDVPFDLKWGIPQIQGNLTSDNVKIGASGNIRLAITKLEVFTNSVLKDQKKINIGKTKPKINNLIRSAMREVVAQYSIEEIQKLGKDELLMMIEPAIVEDLQKLGLSSINFEITGLGIPPEYRFF